MEPDYIWLAGLLEGEGTFCLETNNSGRRYARIALVMTDEDVVARAARIMGRPYYLKNSPSIKKYGGKKQQYVVRTSGQDAVRLMRVLYPQMGQRRRERFEQLYDGNATSDLSSRGTAS